jgi:hypothetical protein
MLEHREQTGDPSTAAARRAKRFGHGNYNTAVDSQRPHIVQTSVLWELNQPAQSRWAELCNVPCNLINFIWPSIVRARSQKTPVMLQHSSPH